MMDRPLIHAVPLLIAGTMLAAACQPAATPATPVPPAKPTAAAAAPASPAAVAKAEASPAAKPAASPAAAASPSPAQATAPSPAAKPASPAVADFFRGKTVKIVVGFAPGGGFDTISRALARHLPQYIPGNPSVIVENMPGAGSLISANHLYNAAPKDGTVIGNFNGQLFLQRALGLEGIQFDPTKFHYLGTPAGDSITCAASGKSGFKSLKDAQKPGGRQFVAGGTAPGSTTDDHLAVLTEALDLDTKLISGYTGTATIRLAMEQGEVDGMCGWSWESIKSSNYDDVVSGAIVPILQVVEEPISDLPVPNVPLAKDVAKTDAGRQLIRYGIIIPTKVIRPYVLPAETPAERVSALQAAFTQVLADAGFKEDLAKIKVPPAPQRATEFEKNVRESQALPEDIKAQLKKILVK